MHALIDEILRYIGVIFDVNTHNLKFKDTAFDREMQQQGISRVSAEQ